MQKKCGKSKNLLSFILCIVLIVAMALVPAGCNGSSTGNGDGANTDAESSNDRGQSDDHTGTDDDEQSDGSEQPDGSVGAEDGAGTEGSADNGTGTEGNADTEDSTSADSGVNSDDSADAGRQSDGGILGEGSTKFEFAAVDAQGGKTQWEIHTDKNTVGEALQELGLIDGDESEFGLYVKTVNGITLDYDKDGMYWAFYINDEYAQSGVDATEIQEGDIYSLKAEKS